VEPRHSLDSPAEGAKRFRAGVKRGGEFLLRLVAGEKTVDSQGGAKKSAVEIKGLDCKKKMRPWGLNVFFLWFFQFS